ncbi:hydrogen peroxide-inducible genes activator [Terricaulis silvestris]|uniref:Morphology and auto-aggregation control protein n=1 Tax=Terricaulis silvestris TaxID=2686094 RepID=A0A6I6MUL8_9CAUL|nr:hydrogen peroxide-inducible genes activator [Terricaulis silvestris]QGZ95352.1 Morphology and auto-aggregation control protein [Terricaulis silvestris]
MEDRLPASSMPTLRQLQFLIALRAQGSFVGAAEAVGVTQPTLSAGIKDLEAVLGAVLVERGRTGAVLTPAGEEAAERAVRAVGEVEDMVRTVQTAGEPFSGVFRLGAIPTIAPFLLPRALPLLKRKFPKLRLQMREDLTARLVEGLRTRTLDAALIALPYEAHGVATAAIAEDEFYLLCPDTHPLAKRNDLSPEHLKNEDVLLLEDGHCLRDHALSACKLTPRRSSEMGATSLHTLVQMVAGGMGVTLLPKIAAEGGAVAGAPVAIRPFETPIAGRAIGVAWREGGQREAEARMLGEVLRELF